MKKILKTPLQVILEKVRWEDIYEEHYGKAEVDKEVDKELPGGEELTKRFYTPERWKRIKNK